MNFEGVPQLIQNVEQADLAWLAGYLHATLQRTHPSTDPVASPGFIIHDPVMEQDRVALRLAQRLSGNVGVITPKGLEITDLEEVKAFNSLLDNLLWFVSGLQDKYLKPDEVAERIPRMR